MPLASFGQQAIPANTLGWSAKIELSDHSSGSGFYLQSKSALYLVTAKHVLFDIVVQNGQLVSTMKKATATVMSYGLDAADATPEIIALDLPQLDKDGKIHPHASQDVVVVKIGDLAEPAPVDPNVRVTTKPLAGVKPLQEAKSGIVRVFSDDPSSLRTLKDVDVGADVYLFGYPSSLGLAQEPPIDPNKPLLRKGAVAGVNSALKSIVIDCPSYFGNSGGPVMEIQQLGLMRVVFAIGVVVSYVPFAQQASSNTVQLALLTNSGYSIVVPMDFVMELVK